MNTRIPLTVPSYRREVKQPRLIMIVFWSEGAGIFASM